MGGGGSVARYCVESSIEGFALLGLGQTWTQLVLWLRLPRCLAAWCGVYAFITGLVPVTISCWHRLCRIASHTHTSLDSEREREGETLRRTSCRCCYGSFFSNVFATYRTATPTHTHTETQRICMWISCGASSCCCTFGFGAPPSPTSHLPQLRPAVRACNLCV